MLCFSIDGQLDIEAPIAVTLYLADGSSRTFRCAANGHSMLCEQSPPVEFDMGQYGELVDTPLDVASPEWLTSPVKGVALGVTQFPLSPVAIGLRFQSDTLWIAVCDDELVVGNCESYSALGLPGEVAIEWL